MPHRLLLLAAAVLTPAAMSAQTLEQAVARAEAAGFRGQVAAADRSRILFDRMAGGGVAPQRWMWGSVSKQVTAALVMMEVEAGRLSLDDTVASRLPAFANAETGQATIRDLLLHTSGLANPTGPDGPAQLAFYTRAQSDSAADATGICAGPATGPRGTFRYNNCDTLVLGAILERVTGRPFARLLRERVAAPLRLSSLRLARPGERVQPDAAPLINVATYGASGAMTGSARDLLRFDQALMNNRLLGTEATATFWRGEPRLGYVAPGAWSFSAPLRGCTGPVRLIERRGDVAGVQTRNIIAPDRGRALVVFTAQSTFDFGEIWRGQGLSYDLASAAFCGPAA